MKELQFIDLESGAKRKEKLKKDRLENLTWDILIAIDPYLDGVFYHISKLEPMSYEQGRVLWEEKYKEKMYWRVGYGAPEYAPAILKSSEAYNIVYSKWYTSLMQGHDSC